MTKCEKKTKQEQGGGKKRMLTMRLAGSAVRKNAMKPILNPSRQNKRKEKPVSREGVGTLMLRLRIWQRHVPSPHCSRGEVKRGAGKGAPQPNHSPGVGRERAKPSKQLLKDAL